MEGQLETTNLLLGIMAAVSVLEALAIIAMGIGGYLAYSKVMTLVNALEARHVAPLMARINAVMDDVKGVTHRVSAQTERVDHAIRHTIDRVDDTADRVKTNVRFKASRLVGIVRGIRAAFETLLTRDQSSHPPHAAATGRF